MISRCIMGLALLETALNGSASSALQDKYQEIRMMTGRGRKQQRIFFLDRGPQYAKIYIY